MSGYVLSPRARRDLDETWSFSAERWGIATTERYIAGIRDACEALATGQRKGRTIDDIRPGYRKLAVGSHVLFFRLLGDGIDIIHLLRQRMDFR